MTFKSAVAGLPLGGGKGVIMLPAGHAPPAGDDRRDVLLDFGDTVGSLDGAYVTAEDVGTSDRDMAVIAEATDHVAGLAVETGSSGDPSPWTALGVLCAMEVACERAFGSASLAGRSVAVVGLGRVGGKLARLLAEAGATLVAADVDEGKRALADELGATWTDPDSALTAEVDVLAPCALGGVLDDDTVPELKCRVIAGAANNQLAADAIAVQLADRGIVWAPDFVANAGGIINIAVEFEDAGYDAVRAEERVRGVSDTTRAVFDHADATGATTLAAAIEIARRRLAEAGRRGLTAAHQPQRRQPLEHARDVAPRALVRLAQRRRRGGAVDAGAVAHQQVPRRVGAQAARRQRAQHRVHADRAAAARVELVAADHLGDDQRVVLRPPERGLLPAREAHDRDRLPRRARDGVRDLQVLDAVALGERRAVAVVAVEQLQHAGDLAEPRGALERLVEGDRVDQPHAAVDDAARASCAASPPPAPRRSRTRTRRRP